MTLQKQTSEILTKNKKQYTRMLREALKGKTGLSHKEVQSTVKRVAKEYREKYGSTPRKRYLSALKEASNKAHAKAHVKPKTPMEIITARDNARRKRILERDKKLIKEAKQKKSTTKQTDVVKPTFPIGTYLIHNETGIVYKVIDLHIISPKNDSWYNYGFMECHSRKMSGYGDKNHNIADHFKKLTASEAHKAWKKYQNKIDNDAIRNKEAEKKRKQEFRELTTINKTWIEKLAKSSNLSPNVVTALYRVCAKDEIRPVMNGIYCDPEGKLVATNAHILVAIDAKVPASMQGKVFAPSGKEIEGKYPKYKKLLLHREGNRFVANAMWENIGRHYVNEKFNPSDTHKYNDAQCFSIKGTVLKVDLYRIIHKVFFTLKETPVCYRAEDQNLKHYPVCFIGNAISAVQMPMCQND